MNRFAASLFAIACLWAANAEAQACRTRTRVRMGWGGAGVYDVRTSGQCGLPATYAQVAVPAPVYARPVPTPVYPPPQPIPEFAAPPMVAAPVPVPVAVAAPVVVAPAPVADAPAHLAFKYLPGFSSTFAVGSDGVSVSTPRFAHSIGVEVRATHWLALRSDLEMRGTSTTWDMLGLKLSVPTRVLSPFVSASVAGTATTTSVSLGVSGALGLDLKLGKHIFFTAETRVRVTPDARSCCGGAIPQFIGLVGGGLAFF
jgi:hypothetical protein